MAAPANGSPLLSASQVPLSKVPPLAPSQELAYRTKCIELRRRLAEIEKSNDETRKRIQRERKAQDKMRLNRAILLNHLKEMMDNGRRLTPEQLRVISAGNKVNMAEELGYSTSNTNIQGNPQPQYLGNESDGTEEEEIAEPNERPMRSKRAYHQGELSMNVSSNAAPDSLPLPIPQPSSHSSQYQPPHLPPLAPASSPVPGNLQSAFRVKKPPTSASFADITPVSGSIAISPLPQPELARPIRPLAPFEHFSRIRGKELAQEGVPEVSISGRVKQDWQEFPESEKREEEAKYNEEMVKYQREMDDFKRAQKNSHSYGGGVTVGISA